VLSWLREAKKAKLARLGYLSYPLDFGEFLDFNFVRQLTFSIQREVTQNVKLFSNHLLLIHDVQ
jgi:hypothetical protein